MQVIIVGFERRQFGSERVDAAIRHGIGARADCNDR
jgi:hypothetical protein